jgi:curli biogenesis system outer membrane secretion channel CsgG
MNVRRIGVAVFLMTIILVGLGSGSAEAQDYQREFDRIAEEVAAAVQKSGLKNIAVVDFTDLQGNVQEIGRFMAEELTTSLVLGQRSFKTIDRANLRNILAEQKLTMTGLINPDNAKKLRISGVDGLVTGTLTPFGESIRLTVKVVSAETAQIVGAARGVVPKTSSMESLGNAIEDSSAPVGSSPHQSAPPKKGKYVFQDANLRVTLKYFKRDSADRVKAIFLIEPIKDGDLRIWWPELDVVDDQGEQWRLVERSGITEFSNFPSSISSQAPLTAFIVFKLEKGTSKAARFSIVGRIGITDGSKTWGSSPTFQDVPPGL